MLRQISVECLHLNISEINIQFLLYIRKTRKSVNDDTVVHLRSECIFAFIVLIKNITDDLFQNIFHRHDTCCLTIFIHHNRHMYLSGLHGTKKLTDVSGLRNKSHFTYQSRQFF